jgi:dsRNA-specific ribonuclease
MEINPYNFNNKMLDMDKVKSILTQYDIVDEPTNLELYQQAFIHKSYSKKKNAELIEELGIAPKPEGAFELSDCDSERLEFLGDSIIGSIIAHYLYERYEDQNEGFLTKLKIKLVRAEAMAYYSKELKLGEYIIMSRHMEDKCNGRNATSILEDCFEAFIGALYLDFNKTPIKSYDFYSGIGYQICEQFIVNFIEANVDFTELIMSDHNYKDRLMKHYQQAYQQTAKYRQISVEVEGDSNERTFVIGIDDDKGNLIAKGIGSSKKKAEQAAAKNTLVKMGVIDEE